MRCHHVLDIAEIYKVVNMRALYSLLLDMQKKKKKRGRRRRRRKARIFRLKWGL